MGKAMGSGSVMLVAALLLSACVSDRLGVKSVTRDRALETGTASDAPPDAWYAAHLRNDEPCAAPFLVVEGPARDRADIYYDTRCK